MCVCVFSPFFCGWVAVGGGESLGKKGRSDSRDLAKGQTGGGRLLFEIMRSVGGGFKDFC